MKLFIKYKLVFLLLLLLRLASTAQNVTISGYIKDGDTGESLIGATIYSTKTKTGTSANTYGFYSLSLPKGDSTGLIFTFLGYQAQIKKVKAVISHPIMFMGMYTHPIFANHSIFLVFKG